MEIQINYVRFSQLPPSPSQTRSLRADRVACSERSEVTSQSTAGKTAVVKPCCREESKAMRRDYSWERQRANLLVPTLTEWLLNSGNIISITNLSLSSFFHTYIVSTAFPESTFFCKRPRCTLSFKPIYFLHLLSDFSFVWLIFYSMKCCLILISC